MSSPLLQGFGGMVLLLGAYLTWRQTQLTRAVDQLGSKDVAVRVGGVYALERVADESITDRASIADLLTAYARRNAPWPPDPKSPFPADFPLDQLPRLSVRAPDIQAILTVLGRHTPRVPAFFRYELHVRIVVDDPATPDRHRSSTHHRLATSIESDES